MNIAIALAQFISIALGVMCSHILVNAGAVSSTSSAWSDLLTLWIASKGLWLLIVPALWLVFAGWCDKVGGSWAKAAPGLGFAIILIMLFGLAGQLLF